MRPRDPPQNSLVVAATYTNALLIIPRPPEILALRKSLWEKVSGRLHKPLKVFPYGANADEVMLFGTVDYELKDGRNASVDWSAHAHLVKEDGKVKMDFYQVYLVSVVFLIRERMGKWG